MDALSTIEAQVMLVRGKWKELEASVRRLVMQTSVSYCLSYAESQ